MIPDAWIALDQMRGDIVFDRFYGSWKLFWQMFDQIINGFVGCFSLVFFLPAYFSLFDPLIFLHFLK